MKPHFPSPSFLGTALVLVLPLTIASEAIARPKRLGQLPPVSPAPRNLVPISPLDRQGTHELRRAVRELQKAERGAYEVNYLAGTLDSAEARASKSLGDRLLNQARTAHEAGEYFRAAETALAAKNLYEAAETLYEGQLGYVSSARGPKPPSPSYYEAPYRVAQELARAEAEAAYYRSNNGTVSDLLRQARELASPVTARTVSTQFTGVNDFTRLTNNRAAIHLAKAAKHLMRVERGF